MSSTTSPLRISSPRSCPEIGMSICPGKVDPYAFSGPCYRNLKTDLDVIAAWGATHIVSLLEEDELEYLHVPDLGDRIREKGITWHFWEVMDGTALRLRNGGSGDPWRQECDTLLHELASGKKVFIHCRGGLGRTGTLAARFLVERGLDPERAIEEVRLARPGALETAEQEDYILYKQWR